MALFRFRSPNRDTDTDERRIGALLSAINAARRGVEAEIAGLRQRLQEARSQGAFLFGTELPSGTAGDPTAERRLREVEESIVGGEKRIRQLETQLGPLADAAKSLAAIAPGNESPLEREALASHGAKPSQR